MLNRIKILDFECKSNTTMGGEVFPRLICAKKQLDIRVQRTIKLCFFFTNFEEGGEGFRI